MRAVRAHVSAQRGMCVCALQSTFTAPEIVSMVELMSSRNWRITDDLTHTHTHNRFTALFDFVRDYPGEPAPER